MGIHEKIFLVEDNLDEVREAYEELRNAGHEIIGYAKNFPDAIKGIKDAIQRKMTVAVVDGNLDYHSDNCADGREVSKAIREQAPGVTIIAFSRSRPTVANFGDLYINKDPKKLAEAVTAIPRK